MQSVIIDLPFFNQEIRTPSSSVDKTDNSGFMENSYSYYTPDIGLNFMINFHPIPWDKNFDTAGKFKNRPGNFINHVFAGDFMHDFAAKGFYLFELFGDKLWDAKEKDYAYYFETPPPEKLNPRDIMPTRSKYTLREIVDFIHNGRSEILAKAIAFLTEQFAKLDNNPKQAKYLVIKDNSTENIEKWIAAIQCAFSPKVAAGISFSTRMDKFSGYNKYTVNINQEGRFSQTINLQDPNQSQRWRAMIIGVDERDRNNFSAARYVSGSDFALIDGGKLIANFSDIDTTHKYYRFITENFGNTKHTEFCRVFLQSFDIKKPCFDILELYDAFDVLASPAAAAVELLNTLKILNNYKTDNPKIRTQLMDLVQKTFENLVFTTSNIPEAAKLWKQLEGGEFAEDIAQYLTHKLKITQNMESSLARLKSDLRAELLRLYIECAKALNKNVSVADLLLPVAQNMQNDDFIKLAMDYIINNDNYAVSSDRALYDFCLRISGLGLKNFIASVLNKRFQKIKTEEYMHFIETSYKLYHSEHLDEKEFGELLVLTDSKISLENKSKIQYEVAAKLLHCGSDIAVLPNSAHLDALVLFSQKVLPQDIIMHEYLSFLEMHGFPQVSDKYYVDALLSGIFSVKLNEQETDDVLDMLTKSSYLDTYLTKILDNVRMNINKWTDIISYAYNIQGELYDSVRDKIEKALIITKQTEKSLNELVDILKSEPEEIVEYFQKIADSALETLNPRKAKKNAEKAQKAEKEKEKTEEPKKKSRIFGGFRRK